MLKSILLQLSQSPRAKARITSSKLAWRFAKRFVAGEHLSQAIEATRVLNRDGLIATLDNLGENTRDEASARAATEAYLDILTAIQTSGVKANASLKLTQLGLDLGEALCRQNLELVLQ